jgi:predicted deacetylase
VPIHVSIHDVSPRYEAEVEHAILLCRARGVNPGLLVVPNLHGRAPLEQAPRYVRRLRELAQEGCQILLHGLYHRARPAHAQSSENRSRIGRWLRQQVASAGEAEFGELNLEQAGAHLDAGLSLFAELGLPVHGFVPPAWIMPRRLLPALAERRVRYTENHFDVIDPVSGRRRASAVMNFATRSRTRLLSSVAYVRAARALRHVLPLRIAIHPPDLRSPLALRETVRLLDWAEGDFIHRVEDLLLPP